MPIGNFPMLSGFMNRQRKPGQQGQQMPEPPAAYMPEQNTAVPEPGQVPSVQPQGGAFANWMGQQGQQAGQPQQAQQPAGQSFWGMAKQSAGQAKQGAFNQQQSAMNTGSPGGRMNRRRF